jgi:hypothetical protein
VIASIITAADVEAARVLGEAQRRAAALRAAMSDLIEQEHHAVSTGSEVASAAPPEEARLVRVAAEQTSRVGAGTRGAMAR